MLKTRIRTIELRSFIKSKLMLTCALVTICFQANANPDLNGIWQVLEAVEWNIEPHAAYESDKTKGNAYDAAFPGLGIVTGGTIPYTPQARTKQQQNFANRSVLDPAAKCYMPGVPRANYMQSPFRIVQTDDHVFIAYQFAQASRTIYLDQPDFEAPVDSWMGHSLGTWDGDRLVVDVTDHVDSTWLDRAGNHHSGKLHVRETYKQEGPDHLRYTATLTDPEVYTKPWSISVLLYRSKSPNAQILDFRCVEFVEELMYGELGKQASPPSREKH